MPSPHVTTVATGSSSQMRFLPALVFLVGLLAFGAVPAHGAESERVYDPVLSLTGNCDESTVDPVADPGCPGGPHPPNPFATPTAVTTDFYGNIYVANHVNELGKGWVDVFTSEGGFITEIAGLLAPDSIAVDSEGNLYVMGAGPKDEKLSRFEPTDYEPLAGNIAYDPTPVSTLAVAAVTFPSIAVNPANDHLLVHESTYIQEFSSAAEGNEPLPSFGKGALSSTLAQGLAVDAVRGRIYAISDNPANPTFGSRVIRVFQLDAPHALVQTIEASETPPGKFGINPKLAVDEEAGLLLVYDSAEVPKAIQEFTPDGKYAATLSFEFKQNFGGGAIGVDNGPFSPDRGYLYVPSHPTRTGHSFAFSPPPDECVPIVESVSSAGVTQGDAELRAVVNPCGLQTHYVFQYTTEDSFQVEGFAGAQTAGEGDIPIGTIGVKVSGAATGLSPGTAYRVRLLATNGKGEDELDATFSTYLRPDSGPCANDDLRLGASALLPDCRAYELVTPGDTNGFAPRGFYDLGPYFYAPQVSPSGSMVYFRVEGGPIPGLGGTGALNGDPYLSTRGHDGWRTASAGPDGTEAASLLTGGFSLDQGHSFWTAEGGGQVGVVEGHSHTSYVRYPDGHSEPLGRGSVATDPEAQGRMIGKNGGHVVFVSVDTNVHEAVRLEPIAPPDGTQAVYDRTPDEVTHVVSLLPGDVTPAAGQNAFYLGASLDGKGVAFSIGGVLYLRHDNEETFEIGENVSFVGVAEGGGRIFYVEDGDLLAFDAGTESVVEFSESGDVIPVNASADGSAAYVVSPSVLTADPNPNGATAEAGQENLYLSREGEVHFVGAVTQRDVEGESNEVEGLGLLLDAWKGGGRLAAVPARTTPDGSVLLFESRAQLTDDDGGGLAQVYRYDSVAGELRCLSCDPTGATTSGRASLQSSRSVERLAPEPNTAYSLVANLRADGKRAFFESEERLVADDTDGLKDVYEWEARGVDTCTRPDGCIYLVSSGRSARDDYLYAVSASGEDVFFITSDLLVPWLDRDETPSIYDARVDGGFAPAATPAECLGEACQPAVAPPADPTVGIVGTGGNVRQKPSTRGCVKGKRLVRRKGKARCVRVRRERSTSRGRRGGHR